MRKKHPNEEHMLKIFNDSAVKYGGIGAPYFNYFGQKLVEYAQVSSGARALDVACGRGAVLHPLAERVGVDGEVIGIDLAEKMLFELEQKPWVRISQMDAHQLTFEPQSFDFIFCAFAFFFFSDPRIVLKEFKRVLKPSGKIALSVWGAMPPETTWILNESDRQHPAPSIALNELKSIDKLESFLSQEGFLNLEIKKCEKSFTYFFEDWWQGLLHQGTRNYFAHLTLKEQDKLCQKAKEYLKEKGKESFLKEKFEAYFVLITQKETL